MYNYIMLQREAYWSKHNLIVLFQFIKNGHKADTVTLEMSPQVAEQVRISL